MIADEICRRYHVEPIGPIDGRTERFYAVTGERRLKHPAVVAVTEAARSTLFGV